MNDGPRVRSPQLRPYLGKFSCARVSAEERSETRWQRGGEAKQCSLTIRDKFGQRGHVSLWATLLFQIVHASPCRQQAAAIDELLSSALSALLRPRFRFLPIPSHQVSVLDED
jgi:hypothetical protein